MKLEVITTKILLVFLLSSSFSIKALANDDFMDLSLEELMQVKIQSASISNLKRSEVPASITTITKKDIMVTPARNIVDLINIYVPGAMSMGHPQGNKIGIRGIIASNNTKYLLVVNGREISDKMKTGVLGEIDQWQLNDIEKIEIIRGPGSVTYGPGAVGGVINITTKTANTFAGSRTGVLLNNDYRSYGGFAEYGHKAGNFSFYTFLSAQRSKGHLDTNFYQPDPGTDNPYSGKDSSQAFDPNDYLADPLSNPHIKFHLDMNFGDNLRWWTRYTRSGQTYDGPSKSESVNGPVASNKVSYQGIISTIEHNTDLSSKTSLETTLSLDSHEYRIYSGPKSPDYSEEFYLNCTVCYSEKEALLRSILRSKVSENFNLAVGLELTHEWVGAPWNQSEDRFFMKDGPILISSLDSDYIGDGSNGTIDPDAKTIVYIGKGWEAYMNSFLFEADYQLSPKLKLLASMRADDHKFADLHTSPRLAAIYTKSKSESYKVFAQQSVRLAQTSSLYISDQLGTDVEPEVLSTVEMKYTRTTDNNMQFDLSLFHNNLRVIAWDGSQDKVLGLLETGGFELEGKYENHNTVLGASHALTKQINFHMDTEQKNGNKRQGISVSDYSYTINYITLEDEGNDLNNWANQSTKFFVNYRLNDNWQVHANSIIYWGMQGAKDELRAIEKGYAKVDSDSLSAEELVEFEEQKAEAQREIDQLREHNAFEEDIRLNASLTYKFKSMGSDMALTLYLQNLTDVTANKRYAYSTGASKYYPHRMEFTEEPFASSIQFTAKF